MSFRDDRDAQRHKIDALEQQLEEARAEADRAREERDLAVRERDAAREGRPEAATGTMGPGTPVYVEWRGTWWDAHVKKVVADGGWEIGYDGWSSQWDEVVGPDRIALRTRPPPGPRARSLSRRTIAILLAVVAAIVVSVWWASGGGPSSDPGGTPVASSAQLAPGTSVWIEWNGSWWPGSVVQVVAPDQVRVHYDGYSEGSDEDVGLARLRLR